MLIDKSPFAALATCGPEGLDCSPRGDLPGFVRIHDDKTLMMPDRRGNNRVDSLRNIVRDPRIALLFLIPGSGSTLRVNGRAQVSADPHAAGVVQDRRQAAAHRHRHDGGARSTSSARAPSCAPTCGIPTSGSIPKTLPTPGQILADMSENRVGGEAYDREWPERARQIAVVRF